MSYDVKCEELAQYFLIDQDPKTFIKPTAENIASLAQHIQDTIEDWFLRLEQDHES